MWAAEIRFPLSKNDMPIQKLMIPITNLAIQSLALFKFAVSQFVVSRFVVSRFVVSRPRRAR